MSYKDKMHVRESRAEYKVLVELQRQHLTDGMFYQRSIILKATTPDFVWERLKIAAYLDGPPHEKSHQMERDEELRGMLRSQGWTVLEFPYTPPLSNEALQQIVDKIRSVLPQCMR